MKEATETKLIIEDSKDEWYGYWEVCSECKHSQPEGGNYCGKCGLRRSNR